MKKNVIAAAIILLAIAKPTQTDQILLTSPIINLVDGTSFGINGELFALLLRVYKDVKIRLFGIPQKNGPAIGMYEFEKEKYSLTELTALETNRKKQYNSQQKDLENNKAQYTTQEFDKKLKKIEQKYEKVKKDLRRVLEMAKDDFLAATSQYIASSRGGKAQTLILMAESCKRHNNPDSFLLRWADEEDGKEGTIMKKEIKTFKEFEQFCRDLSTFMNDLAHSCPKAKRQFIELVKNKKI